MNGSGMEPQIQISPGKRPSKSSTGMDELREAMQTSTLRSLSTNICLIDTTADGTHAADGCVILGGDGEAASQKYNTRFRIDHVQARNGLNKAIMEEECVPCCGEEAREEPKTCMRLFIKSEAFLFSLHMISLGLGVGKEVMDYRAKAMDDLELVHSILETFVAILMILIRMISGWITYRDLKDNAFKCEYIAATNKKEVRGRMIKRWRNVLMAVGAVLIVVSITCFLLFKYLAHLGWTILSNNFCMAVFTVVSGLFMARIENTRSCIKEDQKVAVFFECLLLLHENVVAHKSREAAANGELPRAFDTKRTEHFLRAVEDTNFLEKPLHITAPPTAKTEGMSNMWRAMELQDMM